MESCPETINNCKNSKPQVQQLSFSNFSVFGISVFVFFFQCPKSGKPYLLMLYCVFTTVNKAQHTYGWCVRLVCSHGENKLSGGMLNSVRIGYTSRRATSSKIWGNFSQGFTNTLTVGVCSHRENQLLGGMLNSVRIGYSSHYRASSSKHFGGEVQSGFHYTLSHPKNDRDVSDCAYMDPRCKMHPLRVNPGVPFWMRGKTHKLREGYKRFGSEYALTSRSFSVWDKVYSPQKSMPCYANLFLIIEHVEWNMQIFCFAHCLITDSFFSPKLQVPFKLVWTQLFHLNTYHAGIVFTKQSEAKIVDFFKNLNSYFTNYWTNTRHVYT